MTKIRVDFNRRAKNGQVIGSSRQADGALSVGDRVEAIQPEEDMAFEATVAAIDERGRVFLDMVWEPEPVAAPTAAPAKPLSDWYKITVKVAQGFTAPYPTLTRHGVSGLATRHLTTA